MENIKDFLLTSEDIAAAKEQKTKKSSTTTVYHYSVEASTDTDIVIKKVSKTGKSTTKLVLLMSENLYYLLKSNGKTEHVTRLGIRSFFRQYPGKSFETGHQIWDVFHIDEYKRESTERAILFMIENEKFYTNLDNSFVPLSACSEIVSHERYNPENSYDSGRKKNVESRLDMAHSAMGRYMVQKIVEKEGKTKNEILRELYSQRTSNCLYSEKSTYSWRYAAEQMNCFCDIQKIWPDAITKFIDKWVASEDYSLSSDCIAHVIFAVYTADIVKYGYSYAVRGCIDSYAKKQGKQLAYPFDRESDKFIDFLFEEPKKYFMDDRLSRWCELWCQDLSMQLELYGGIKEAYPENLPIHALHMFKVYREYNKKTA